MYVIYFFVLAVVSISLSLSFGLLLTMATTIIELVLTYEFRTKKKHRFYANRVSHMKNLKLNSMQQAQGCCKTFMCIENRRDFAENKKRCSISNTGSLSHGIERSGNWICLMYAKQTDFARTVRFTILFQRYYINLILKKTNPRYWRIKPITHVDVCNTKCQIPMFILIIGPFFLIEIYAIILWLCLSAFPELFILDAGFKCRDDKIFFISNSNFLKVILTVIVAVLGILGQIDYNIKCSLKSNEKIN